MTAAAGLYPSLRDRAGAVTGGGRGPGLEMAPALVQAGVQPQVFEPLPREEREPRYR